MKFLAVGVAAADVCKFCSLLVSDRFGGSDKASDGITVHSFSKSHVHSAKTGNTEVSVTMVTCFLCSCAINFNKLNCGRVQDDSCQSIAGTVSKLIYAKHPLFLALISQLCPYYEEAILILFITKPSNHMFCRSQVTSKSIKQLIVNTATFSYPDPSKVKGNPGFVSCLSELARLEAETIRSEQAKASQMSGRSRPASPRSLKSSVSSSAAASSKSSYQLPNRRTSLNAGTSRVPFTLKRMNSSPAIGAYAHRGGGGAPSVVNSISKQISCATRSRKSSGELETVDETTSKSDISLLNDR